MPPLATTSTIKLLARYNETVNAAMNKTIARLADQEWTGNLGGFHPSVKALCAHLYVCDLNWMKRLGDVRPFRTLSHRCFAAHHPWDAVLIEDVDDYLTRRRELDALLTEFVGEFEEEDLDARLRYIDWRGTLQDRDVAGLLLHLFHHQTHHRGMISVYLEILGHDNEFSSLVPYV